MTRAFIVHLNVDDSFVDPVGTAQDIEEALSPTFDVVSVAMWTAPTLTQPTTQPTFQQQPPPL